MKTLDLIQGSPEWLAARAQYFTASEAPAMLGLSKYTTRSELLRQKATGIVEEVDAAKQRLFDAGHAAEAAARPLAEEMLGEELYPATGVLEVEGLPLLASFDGITMDETQSWENKMPNAEFSAYIRDEQDAPDTHWPQLEQQLLVSGAMHVLFTVGDKYIYYRPHPERRAKLIAGWKQFAIDLANYQHVEVIPAAVAAPTMQLPAVSVQVSGSIALISNLDVFGVELKKFIEGVDMSPTDDQGFANAESAIKTLEKAQGALEQAEQSALAQTASIDDMRRTVALYVDQARTTRLMLEKMVKARKESIRIEIMQEGKNALTAHINALNKRLGKNLIANVPADFSGAIKGKKTIASLREAVNNELLQRKMSASEITDKVQDNLQLLDDHKDHSFLFNDVASIVFKDSDDLYNVIKMRISEHEAKEAKRLEAEREKIRQEERANAEREQAAKAAAEREAQRITDRAEQTRLAEVARKLAADNAAAIAERDRAEAATKPKKQSVYSTSGQTSPGTIVNVIKEAPAPAADYNTLLLQIGALVQGMNTHELADLLDYCNYVISQREEEAA